MVFSSLPFLFLFLTVVLLVSHILPFRFRNFFLLLANLVFYAYGEPVYVLIMIGSILVNFFAGLLMDKQSTQGRRRAVLVVGIVLNLAALGVFKYAGLFVSTLREIPGLSSLPEVDIALPIGISFYTFQAVSYLIDVYWDDCAASHNLINFASYISLFPQLIAGPIVRYKDVNEQLVSRRETPTLFNSGVRLFVVGLAKKVLLANQFGMLWDAMSADPVAAGALGAWAGACAYTLQIYFDFAGYSDMARGLGRMLGFEFCINFNYPYISKSVTEFWRRWHISLSTCGVVPGIRRLAELELQLTLSVSLHAPDSETRSKIMPINRAYDVEELFRACHDYFDRTGRRISFEYAMIDGVNDHDWQADLIAKKLRGMPGHVNLIPLNDVVESPYKPSRRIGAFQKRLESHGVTATVRRSLGGDIDASCGQLRRKAMEEAQKGEDSQ